jgi:LacI family transcriptional regulator, gluconate utilization system Gnt-I transcriptional repressor
MTSSTRPPTLADVARHAGVSKITASRALSNPQVVAAGTIEKVRESVAATGYVPNLIAGGLKSRRSRLVAVLVPSIVVSQFLPTLDALTETLGAAGYQLIIGQSGFDHSREDALIDTLLSRRPDGMVLIGPVHGERTRARLRASHIPVVEAWDLNDQPVNMVVGFSHLAVGQAVARYFLDKGVQRVGVATGNDPRGTTRLKGFVEAMGRDIPVAIVDAPGTMRRGRAALRELLGKQPDLQAVFCSSDLLALGALAEAQARGLRVPEELAICGFGGAEFAADTEPPLTTVQIDGAAIGRLAAQLILERCRGQVVKQRVIDVGFRIVERQSTNGMTLEAA